MKSILEELWYGKICPETDSRTNTPEIKRLMKYIARHHDNLMETMTDEQKDILSGSTIVGASMPVLPKSLFSCMRSGSEQGLRLKFSPPISAIN